MTIDSYGTNDVGDKIPSLLWPTRYKWVGSRQHKPDLSIYTDGYYDFTEKLWKSGNEVIPISRWNTKDEFQVFPVMLDRLAFTK